MTQHENVNHHYTGWKQYVLSEELKEMSTPTFWILLLVVVLVLLLSATMAGLTVGLMSIDELKMRLLQRTGTSDQKRAAKKLAPLLKDQHLLLTTIVFVNCVCMEVLPKLLDKFLSDTAAIITSVTLILIFGEIVPQAACLDNPVGCGASVAWLITLLKYLCYIVTKPIAMATAYILGHEKDDVLFKKNELAALLEFYQDSPTSSEHGKHSDSLAIHGDAITIMQGALKAGTKKVKDIAMPLEKVFMIEAETILTAEVIQDILKSGHSRIPVYYRGRDNVVGLILVKRLLLLCMQQTQNENKTTTARESIHIKPLFFESDKHLLSALNDFQVGHSHLAVVKSVNESLVGIVTLEDVIEELIQEDITDECDTTTYISVQAGEHIV